MYSRLIGPLLCLTALPNTSPIIIRVGYRLVGLWRVCALLLAYVVRFVSVHDRSKCRSSRLSKIGSRVRSKM